MSCEATSRVLEGDGGILSANETYVLGYDILFFALAKDLCALVSKVYFFLLLRVNDLI